MLKKFTSAQKELLEKKLTQFNIARAQLDEIIDYLRKEHNVDGTWQILNDLSGFEKIRKKELK